MRAPPIDATHDPARRSWVDGADGHADFPVQNLPYGVFSPAGGDARAGVAISHHVLDLRAAAAAGLLPDTVADAVSGTTLNVLMAADARDRTALRARLSELLSDAAHHDRVAPLLYKVADCAMHLPAVIGDFTDFYAGIHHAVNVGRLFRPDQPLLPNYKHVPIGYHGRASSVRVSGTPLVRPNGQRKAADADTPVFGPSTRLDYELELGVWIGRGNALGLPVPIGEAAAHVAGYCLLNDWSARDLQAWEYQPLGPFLAKSFHTTISPWLVTAEALAPFRLAHPARPEGDPAPLLHLWDEDDQHGGALALDLDVSIATATMRANGVAPHRLSRAHATDLYWTVAQMIAHHTSNGCDLRTGDLLGTGTISGRTRDEVGSLLEHTVGGREPIALPGGEQRTFLEDGDEVIFHATARADGFVPIGFGECRAVVLPAI